MQGQSGKSGPVQADDVNYHLQNGEDNVFWRVWGVSLTLNEASVKRTSTMTAASIEFFHSLDRKVVQKGRTELRQLCMATGGTGRIYMFV